MAEKNNLPILTQLSATKCSEVIYHHVVLYSWDVDEELPFEIYPRNSFSSNEIPDEWYTNVLSDTLRHQKQELSGLRGKHYSVFCKIEESTYFTVIIKVR